MTALNLPPRIYSQYADKEKLKAWLNISREIGEEIAQGAQDVRNSLDIDTASGESLRIISRIVAVDNLKQEILMNAGYFSDPDGTELGDLKNLFAVWSTQNSVSASDEILRTICRAKIIRNTIDPTMDNLLDAINFILPSAQAFRLVNYHDMSFGVQISGTMTPTEEWLLKIVDFLPTPAGVNFRGIVIAKRLIEFLNIDSNSFDDDEMEFVSDIYS